MKRAVIILIATIAANVFLSDVFVAHAQNRGGTVTASSMIVTRTKIKKPKEPVKIRWQNNIDVATTGHDHHQLSYTGGWRFGNFFYFGFGTGVQYYPNVLPWDENGKLDMTTLSEDMKEELENSYYNPSQIAVPVYAQVKFRFLKGRISPFLSASGGLIFQGWASMEEYDKIYCKDGVEGLPFFDAVVGVDFKLKNDSIISFGIGPVLTGQNARYPKAEEDRSTGCFKLGFSF